MWPKHHRYYKLFNRNTVKVSYSCMPNMAAIISSHNTKVLSPTADPNARTCSCIRPNIPCPLDGHCLAECIVYKATATAEAKPPRHYYRLTEPEFKKRYAILLSSFRHEELKTAFELSKYVWDLKAEGSDYAIKWEIVQHAARYRCGTRRCDLCLTEKMVIASDDSPSMLNNRAQLVSTCRHRAKFIYSKLR